MQFERKKQSKDKTPTPHFLKSFTPREVVLMVSDYFKVMILKVRSEDFRGAFTGSHL